MLDLIINSSLETIFPKNEIKKIIIDLEKGFGHTLSQSFIIYDKNNLQSKNIKEIFLFKNVFKEIKKISFFPVSILT